LEQLTVASRKNKKLRARFQTAKLNEHSRRGLIERRRDAIRLNEVSRFIEQMDQKQLQRRMQALLDAKGPAEEEEDEQRPLPGMEEDQSLHHGELTAKKAARLSISMKAHSLLGRQRTRDALFEGNGSRRQSFELTDSDEEEAHSSSEEEEGLAWRSSVLLRQLKTLRRTQSQLEKASRRGGGLMGFHAADEGRWLSKNVWMGMDGKMDTARDPRSGARRPTDSFASTAPATRDALLVEGGLESVAEDGPTPLLLEGEKNVEEEAVLTAATAAADGGEKEAGREATQVRGQGSAVVAVHPSTAPQLQQKVSHFFKHMRTGGPITPTGVLEGDLGDLGDLDPENFAQLEQRLQIGQDVRRFVRHKGAGLRRRREAYQQRKERLAAVAAQVEPRLSRIAAKHWAVPTRPPVHGGSLRGREKTLKQFFREAEDLASTHSGRCEIGSSEIQARADAHVHSETGLPDDGIDSSFQQAAASAGLDHTQGAPSALDPELLAAGSVLFLEDAGGATSTLGSGADPHCESNSDAEAGGVRAKQLRLRGQRLVKGRTQTYFHADADAAKGSIHAFVGVAGAKRKQPRRPSEPMMAHGVLRPRHPSLPANYTKIQPLAVTSTQSTFVDPKSEHARKVAPLPALVGGHMRLHGWEEGGEASAPLAEGALLRYNTAMQQLEQQKEAITTAVERGIASSLALAQIPTTLFLHPLPTPHYESFPCVEPVAATLPFKGPLATSQPKPQTQTQVRRRRGSADAAAQGVSPLRRMLIASSKHQHSGSMSARYSSGREKTASMAMTASHPTTGNATLARTHTHTARGSRTARVAQRAKAKREAFPAQGTSGYDLRSRQAALLHDWSARGVTFRHTKGSHRMNFTANVDLR
jgi:hypothetical protein